MATQAKLPADSATASILSLSQSLGIDENALVDAFVLAGNGKGIESLRRLVEAQKAVDALKLHAIQSLRTGTWNQPNWSTIGEALGVSAQAVQRKYSPLIPENARDSRRYW